MDYSRDGSEDERYTKEEIQKIKDAGIVPIAYISIGEAEDYRFYWKDEWFYNKPEWLGKENPEWEGNYAVKDWHEEWKRIVFQYLDKIIEQGFCGVYLDRVDAFESYNESEKKMAIKMIDFIVEISNYCRNKTNSSFYIIPQNGERLLDYDDGRLLNVISAWAVEDLFYNGLKENPKDEVTERIFYLDKILKAGKPVLSVDYIDDGSNSEGNLKRIKDYRNKALKMGLMPYAALYDRELDELNVIEGLQP
ncbi:MAG: endo alpha-1,4 polygalactosaminidase [Archaeoglobaceae archaeon]|nr:endo alpha-1,4 polygalactosaminidase [Archaeoglobaceae archaeon]